MSNQERKRESEVVRVELKYCEHCGGLWVRESGTGVYCGKCEAKVADLPSPKKPRRLMLPQATRAQIVKYLVPEESLDLEGVGGVA